MTTRVLLVALAILLLSGGVNYCQYRQVGSLNARVGQVTTERDSAQSANVEQATAIKDLTAANDEWAKLGKSPSEVAADLQSLTAAQHARDVANAKLAEVRSHVAPPCRALIDTNLDAVCPDVGRSLPNRSAHR